MQLPRQEERSKFNVGPKAERTGFDGYVYDSTHECKLGDLLVRAVRPGCLYRQTRFELVPPHTTPWGVKKRAMTLTIDFLVCAGPYWDQTQVQGKDILLLDAKGMIMPDYELRLKWFEWKHEIQLHLVKASKAEYWRALKLVEAQGLLAPNIDIDTLVPTKKLPQAQWDGALKSRQHHLDTSRED